MWFETNLLFVNNTLPSWILDYKLFVDFIIKSKFDTIKVFILYQINNHISLSKYLNIYYKFKLP